MRQSQPQPPQQIPMMPAASGFSTALKVATGFVLGMASAFLLMIQVVPENSNVDPSNASSFFVPQQQGGDAGGAVDVAGDTSGGQAAVGGQTGTAAAGGSSGGGVNVGGGGGSGSSGGAGGGQKAGLACERGKNGGETDVGVTADKIRLASNKVTDGVGANFLGESPIAMEAVIRRVNNKEGGICGRKLELYTVNDGWDATRGRRNIEDFIKQKYFALPVVPSSEGLSAAIEAELISKEGIPVIGTDGMLQQQYLDEWVAPVATATISQVRIMAKYAADNGAKTFGIVYDQRYKFGEEGAAAFEEYVKDVLKLDFRIGLAIAPNQSSYPESSQFTANGKCDPCDAVVMLLEPETGKSWMASVGTAGKGTVMTAGAQPLFNQKFARGCGEVCNGMLVWTGYNPAIGPNKSKGDIARYISDVQAVNPSVDIENQFVEGAYLGMEVFVDLVRKCSPNLTRDCIKQQLQSKDYTYTSDFSSPLAWNDGDHFANLGARAYAITYSQGSYSGFTDKQTGFIKDPTPGKIPG